MSRVAVTGAGGFVGSHLVLALASRGHDVLSIVRRAESAHDVAMDDVLARPTSLGADVDTLIHAAAVRHRHGVDARTYRASNVELIERLMRALAGRVRRFVLVSSVGVYGFPRDLPITEAHPFAPRTLYSATKVHAEKAARVAASAAGMELVIVRPTIVYGVGDRNGMLDKMADMIAAHRYLLVGRGKNVLHHTYIDDIVDGVLLAAASPAAAGEDFILCGPETTTLAALSAMVAKNLGARVPPVHVPLGLARAVATAVDVATYRGWAFAENEPPINHEKLDVMTVPIAFDATKARRLIGYAPRVGYEEGVAKTLRGRR